MSYLTDGVHLYEKLHSCQNFGLAGGAWLTVRDCLTDTRPSSVRLPGRLPFPGASVMVGVVMTVDSTWQMTRSR